MTLDDVIDVNEAGELLDLGVNQIAKLLRADKLPGRKLGIGWIMSRAAIRQIARRRRKWHSPPL